MLLDQPRNTNRNDKLASIKFRLYLAKLSSVDIDNFPVAVNATISSNPLLAGQYFKYIDTLINTLKPNAAPGESPQSGKLALPFSVEGLSKSLLTWIYANVGEEFISIWERCSDGQKFIGGSPCSGGLVLKYTGIGEISTKNLGAALSLDGADCPEPFLYYDGPVPREAAVAIAMAAGTTFPLGVGSQYTMTDNAAAKVLSDITAVTDGDVGRIIELVGAGVNFPTSIATSAKFILRAGLSYSLAVGNSISFQITKTDTGYAFYEVDRR